MKMNIIDLLLITVTMFSLSAGQILFKITAQNINGNLINLLTSRIFFIALFIYGITTVLWLYVLTRIPLYKAYPFYGMSFIIIPFFSYIYLKEPVYINTFIGGILIIAGIYITVGVK